MVGPPSYQVSGTRPLNQAPIRRSCSGPDGGGLSARRRPLGPLNPALSFVILRDYMITGRKQPGRQEGGPPIPGAPGPMGGTAGESAEGQLEPDVGGDEAETPVEAVGILARRV